MKIAACLGVKDEIELIRPVIAHLRRIGVDHIFASDAGSTDGTESVLAELARNGGLDHLPFDDRTLTAADEDALTEDIMARARAIGADWLMFVDADEFPLPRGGRLDLLPGLEHADVLVVPRYNVVVRASGAAFALNDPFTAPEAILVHLPAENRHAVTARLRADPEAAWIMGLPAPKVMVRPDRVHTTAEGHHNAGGDDLRTATPQGFFIAHLPFTTTTRFARKIDNIRRSIAATGTDWPQDSAWHWRRWLDNVDNRGGIAGEMARNLVTEAQLALLRDAGLVRSAVDLWQDGPPDISV